MNVLVTGGAGFVGSWLVDRLVSDGHTVDVIDDLSTGTLRNLSYARSLRTGTLKFHQCDVRDDGVERLIERRAPEVVFHLATSTARPSGGVPCAEEADRNLLGTLRVLDAAAAAGARKFVAALRARGAVAAGLSGVVQRTVVSMLLDAREALGIEVTLLDVATVFGPRQRPGTESSVVATFADRLRRGVPCVIHGAGEQSRDFVYVDDVADALVRAADAADGLVIGVGTGTAVSIAELYGLMAGIVEAPDEPVHGAVRPGDVDEVVVDPARASLYLGWSPVTGLADGLTATLDDDPAT